MLHVIQNFKNVSHIYISVMVLTLNLCQTQYYQQMSFSIVETYCLFPTGMKSTTNGRFVKTNSSNIWTVTVNAHLDAVPLVLVHGMGGGVAMWIQNLDSLGNTRPIYAIDLLGFGRSSRPTFSTDAEEAEAEFVRSLEEWRQEVKLDRFILLGHSLGGFVSSAYAIQNPWRIEHLILADPWGYAEKPTDTEFRQHYPLWARALVKVLQPFNPFTALRVAGPYGKFNVCSVSKLCFHI